MVKVIVQGHIVGPTSYDSHPYRSMSINPPIPEIWLLQNLTLKGNGLVPSASGHYLSQY